MDITHAQLRRAGVAVSDPAQFNEIGYMCRLCDSAGFSIELLQHSFLGNRDNGDGDPSKPLGGGARIGQITLRVSDLSGALSFYRDRLGMKLLSIQAVREFGFVLYFLAFTDESPPNADLDAVENREWLWRRPYTTLELQYFPDRSSAFELPREGNPGFDGLIVFRGSRSSACLQDEAGGAVYLTR